MPLPYELRYRICAAHVSEMPGNRRDNFRDQIGYCLDAPSIIPDGGARTSRHYSFGFHGYIYRDDEPTPKP